MSIRSRPAAGVFSNRAANSICSGAQHGFQRLKYFGAHRSLRRPLTKARYFFSQVTLLAFPYSASTPTSCRTPKHSDILPRAESSTNRKFVFRDYFAEEKPAAQGRASRRHCRRHKEGCRGALPVACRRGWSRILTGFPTAVILFKVIFRILPSNRKRQREVRTEVRTEACATRCCVAKSCATKSRVTK